MSLALFAKMQTLERTLAALALRVAELEAHIAAQNDQPESLDSGSASIGLKRGPGRPRKDQQVA